ncbi:MAG: ABC transporter substrate-binding protein [Anaeroplasma sp.]
MKKIFYLSVLLLCSFSLVACGIKSNQTDNDDYVLITDYEGEKKVNYNPNNVALLYPSFADIWIATGGSIKIGVEDLISRGFTDNSITIVGSGTGKNIDVESLIKANPDFVILSSDFPNHIKIANLLGDYGISYCIFSFSTFDDYLHILSVFSKINRSENVYQEYGIDVLKQINTVINSAKEKQSKKVLLLRATSTTIKALDKNNFVGEMINKLNCTNIADTDSLLTATLSMENIITIDPEVIIVVPMGEEEQVFKLASDELAKDTWKTISAIKNNNVYYMEKDLFHYKPNLRWGEAYEILSQRIFSK